ncbi:hypothetical protein LCGC14_0421440 [marine sediment metagenome]|uniref:Uncharacterized protein n=1 Tax=marine sediment metagenome TaxID=412755 RepID=A0A0F9T8V7_9ZZZZ
MAKFKDFQVTVRIKTSGFSLLLKLLLIPMKIWAMWMRLKCRVLRRAPMQIKMDLSYGD